MKKIKTDFLIIGAGISGLTLAWNLRNKFPNSKISIIDKEREVGMHTSGRNSGVLHAGFYYSPDSFKAKFTRQGNTELTKYCEKNSLKINKCGKVVVTKSEEEIETLYELKRRGDLNGIDISLIDDKELKDLEPNAKTYKKALWSHSTSVVDPIEVLRTLKTELERNNIKFYFGTCYKKKIDKNAILANDCVFEYKKIINVAGLYADKIAKDFGCAKNYVLVPFKGVYLKYEGSEQFVKRNIYPVPNIKNPFLGVHFTVKADGKIKIGPTAMPCFWRENYQKMNNFNLKEFIETIIWDSRLFLTSSLFRRTAFEEIRKYAKKIMINSAESLVNYVDKKNFKRWDKPGIRAQLLNTTNLELVQDFVVEKADASIHILNAVSPAFTASFPFTRFIIENFIINGG